MNTQAGMSLMEQLKEVPDPRIERTRRHELMDMLRGGFNLAHGDDREFSIELDPRQADPALLDELERRGASTGLATLCVGAGMGTATIIERI